MNSKIDKNTKKLSALRRMMLIGNHLIPGDMK